MANILDLAQPVTEVSTSVNMLLHADSGVGKTVFAGSGREGGKNDLIIDIEGGSLSAARSHSKASAIHVKDYGQLIEIIEAIEDEPDRFEWVIVDSITKLQDLIWSKIMDDAISRNPSRSPHKRELQEYGEAQSRLKAIVERLNNSEANILWTALSDTEVDEDGNNVKVPAIHGQQGKLSAWVSAQMDVVAYMKVMEINDKETRVTFFNRKPEFYAKDRLRVFRKAQQNLTLGKFTDKILEGAQPESNNNDNNDNKEN